MRRLILFALAFTAAAVLVPTVAVADSATHTYLLEMGEPNLGVAANGDQIAITGTPIPSFLCGGAVKMNVTLTPTGTSLHLPAIMTVFCVIGTHAPQSVLGPLTEGVTLNVPGIQNFNHSAGGDNDYVQIS